MVIYWDACCIGIRHAWADNQEEITNVNKTRRSFVSALGAGVFVVPLSHLILSRPVFAADTPKLSPDDPTAKSLEYTHESPDSVKRCAKCQFYTGAADAEWGPCVIFPGKLVNAEGLCKSWYQKAA